MTGRIQRVKEGTGVWVPQEFDDILVTAKKDGQTNLLIFCNFRGEDKRWIVSTNQPGLVQQLRDLEYKCFTMKETPDFVADRFFRAGDGTYTDPNPGEIVPLALGELGVRIDYFIPFVIIEDSFYHLEKKKGKKWFLYNTYLSTASASEAMLKVKPKKAHKYRLRFEGKTFVFVPDIPTWQEV